MVSYKQNVGAKKSIFAVSTATQHFHLQIVDDSSSMTIKG
jgi:hypothetical protein